MIGHVVERDWTTKAGLRAVCLYVRQSHRCGYVAVPRGHPLHGVKYSEHCEALRGELERIKGTPIGKRGIISLVCWDGERASPEIVFDVHGGLTYSGIDSDGYPLGEKNDAWWFGFDCAHAGDGTGYNSGEAHLVRTEEYVVSECESLAEQLAVFARAPDELATAE